MKVQPIRDYAEIERIERALAANDTEKGLRKYLLFECGIYLARRVCDIIEFKVSDLRDKESLFVYEHKTRKKIELPIPNELQRFIKRMTRGKGPNDYIFQSPVKNKDGSPRPISYRTAYNYLKEIAEEMGLDYNVATHSMRKTFGYHFYQQTHDIATLMDILNHDNPKDTLVYIGIAFDNRKHAIAGFKYKPLKK